MLVPVQCPYCLQSHDEEINPASLLAKKPRTMTPAAIEQRKNAASQRAIMVTHDEKTQSIGVWCRELGLKPNTVTWRMKRGSSPYEALGLAVKQPRKAKSALAEALDVLLPDRKAKEDQQ